MARDGLQNFIKLEGCFNFRDVGGYHTLDGRTVKSGSLFRADGRPVRLHLHGMPSAFLRQV